MNSALSSNAFADVSHEEWKQAIENSLKETSWKEFMMTSTGEGFDLHPVYSDASDTFVDTPIFPKKQGSWKISQELTYVPGEQFRDRLRDSLENGLTEINIRFPKQWIENVDAITPDSIRQDFERVDPQRHSVYFQCGEGCVNMARLLFQGISMNETSPASLTGCMGADPLGILVEQGHLAYTWESVYDNLKNFVVEIDQQAPEVQSLLVEGTPYHRGGANNVQQLGFVLASTAEYLRKLGKRGLHTHFTAPKLRWSFSVGSSFYMEIAKLRAARILWTRMAEVLQVNNTIWIHARTGEGEKAEISSHTHLIRSTVESFAAVLGNSDSLNVAPAVGISEEWDDFSIHMARNIQLILKEEFHLDQLVDPVAGSWAIESITARMVKEAWKVFQSIERHGGMSLALAEGIPQQMINESTQKKRSGTGASKSEPTFKHSRLENEVEGITVDRLFTDPLPGFFEQKGCDA